MAQSVDVTELIKQREHVDRASCQQWEAQYNVERTIESQQGMRISFVAYRAHLGGAQWRKPTLNLSLTCCSSSGFGVGFLHGPFTRHRLNKDATAMLAWEPGCTPGTIGNTQNNLIKCSALLDRQVTP